jgi:hypothetical protein
MLLPESSTTVVLAALSLSLYQTDVLATEGAVVVVLVDDELLLEVDAVVDVVEEVVDAVAVVVVLDVDDEDDVVDAVAVVVVDVDVDDDVEDDVVDAVAVVVVDVVVELLDDVVAADGSHAAITSE